MTSKVPYTTRIDETLYAKLKYVAKKDVRSLNNLLELLMVKCVEEYESQNGVIPLDGEE